MFAILEPIEIALVLFVLFIVYVAIIAMLGRKALLLSSLLFTITTAILIWWVEGEPSGLPVVFGGMSAIQWLATALYKPDVREGVGPPQLPYMDGRRTGRCR